MAVDAPIIEAPEQAVAQPAPPEAPTVPSPAEEAQEQIGAVDADLADIEKPVEERVWKWESDFTLNRGGELIPQHFVGEYTQKPLSYFAFLEFTGLLARKIEEAMRGDDGITIKDIVETTKGALPFMVDGDHIEEVITKQDFDGIDAFVQGLMKLVSYVPDVIEECQFIWLRVPRRDRAFVREIWGKSPADGGLSNDEGEEMMTLFIEQNYEELESFFVDRLPRITRTAQKMRTITMKDRDELPAGSRRSKPWSRTPALTESQ